VRGNKFLVVTVTAIAFLLSISFGIFFSFGKTRNSNDIPNELLIYSPHPQDMVAYIVKEFRQRTGVRVKVSFASTGSIIEKVKRSSSGERFDLVWGGGIESLETVKENFIAYRSPEDASIIDEYTSPHGLWKPFSVLPIVIMYNRRLVPPDQIPISWGKLLDPYFHNRVAIANPDMSGSAYTILVTILRAMSKSDVDFSFGWAYVDSLLDQVGSEGIVPGPINLYDKVAAGEFFAGVTFENSAQSLQKAGKEVGFCYPQEGTSAVPDGIALLKDAPHPDLAKAFIDFVLGYDVQSILMARWYRRCVRRDTQKFQSNFATLKLISYPVTESASMRQSILARWVIVRDSHSL